MKSLLLASLLLIATPSFPTTLHLGRFSAGDLTGWTPETFRGKALSGDRAPLSH